MTSPFASPQASPFAHPQTMAAPATQQGGWGNLGEAPQQPANNNWSNWFSRGTQQGGYNPFSIFGGWMNRQQPQTAPTQAQPGQPPMAPGGPPPVPQQANPNEPQMWSQSTPPGHAITDADHALPFLLGAGRSISPDYHYNATDPGAVNPMIQGQNKVVGLGINLRTPNNAPTPSWVNFDPSKVVKPNYANE